MKKILFLLLIILSAFSCSKAKYYLQVSISTEPQGAKIYINDKYVGMTPLDRVKVGILMDKSIPVSIRTEKPFYFPHSETWQVSSEKDKTVVGYHFTLKPGIKDYTGDFRKHGQEVEFNKLFSKTSEQLLLYKYEISAKYGASFTDKDIQGYFEKTSWYKENPDYTDRLLNHVDEKNINLIDTFAKNSGNVGTDRKTIVGNVEYSSPERTLQFVSEDTVLETGQSTYVGYSPYNAQYFNYPKRWHSLGPLVFVEQVTDFFTVYLLNHSTRKIEWFREQVSLDIHSQACLLNSFAVIEELTSSGFNGESYDRNVYHPVKAFDGNEKTAWLENYSGFGKDSYISFVLDHEVVINEVRIKGGYFNPDYFATNNRLKNIVLYYSDGRSNRSATQELALNDIMEEQRFALSSTFMRTFDLLIKDAYLAEGQDWCDTAISEVSFYYRGEKIEIGLGEFSVYTQIVPE